MLFGGVYVRYRKPDARSWSPVPGVPPADLRHPSIEPSVDHLHLRDRLSGALGDANQVDAARQPAGDRQAHQSSPVRQRCRGDDGPGTIDNLDAERAGRGTAQLEPERSPLVGQPIDREPDRRCVAGRHAASGDFRAIRRLMTDRPHMLAIRSSDDRRLAAALIAYDSTRGVELTAAGLEVEVVDFRRFGELLPSLARTAGIRLLEVTPADESLESVFSYLVAS